MPSPSTVALPSQKVRPGHETDFRDIDGAEPPRRIDPVAHRTSGEDAGTDIVADRIAGEAGQRRRPIWHVVSPDRTQRKQVIEGEREIAARHERCRERGVAPIRGRERLDHFADIDVMQSAIQHHDRNDDDRDAEHEADPVPADLFVAEPRGPTQSIEHPTLAIRLLRLHRSTCHGASRKLPLISSSRRPISNPRIARDRRYAGGVSSRWRSTLSKTRAGARGLGPRQRGMPGSKHRRGPLCRAP